MYGIRQDTPEGWLRCDGNGYPASAYNSFVNNYIKTGKIQSVTLAQYEEELLNNNNNCGYIILSQHTKNITFIEV
ncbi:MAG: hypothetical protein LBG48_05865 [Rickettsiales bacterium]|nr:hypothetical protein [Rickettsiales bacterium]